MEAVTDWNKRYQDGNTGWDIGYVSTPLKAYFDQLIDKDIKILVPGGGNGYEAAYLHKLGFPQVYLLDIAPIPLQNFAESNPGFPNSHLIQDNFFHHEGQYDLLVEQTFFCAIDPKHRAAYANKVTSLLKPSGKLVGLLWSVPMNSDKPPFGGHLSEYQAYFDPYFDYLYFEDANNSIPPRAGTELFLLAQKK